MSRLPSPYRPERKIAELKAILRENSQAEFANLEEVPAEASIFCSLRVAIGTKLVWQEFEF